MRGGKAVKLLMSLETRFPFGVAGFTACLYSDGSSLEECQAFTSLTEAVKSVRLSKKDRNQGEASGLKLLQLRVKKYKEEKNKYLVEAPIDRWFLGLKPGKGGES